MTSHYTLQQSKSAMKKEELPPVIYSGVKTPLKIGMGGGGVGMNVIEKLLRRNGSIETTNT